MIHDNGPNASALVLYMTFSAPADIGVKCSRLALQQVLVGGMADDAIRRFNTPDGRVANGALVLQKRMCFGKAAWAYEVLEPAEVRGYVNTKHDQGSRC